MTSCAALAAEPFIATKDLVVFDRQRLRELTDGDTEFERELIDTYLTSVRAMLGDLRANLLARNAAAVAKEAHALKGASFNVGAISMAKYAAELEMSARTGNVDPIDAAFEGLRVEEQALWSALAGC